MAKPRFYLAAPFFNLVQIALVEKIEGLFKKYDYPLFSPRLQHGNKTTKIETSEQARQVFDKNLDEILACTHMLAVVDWLLPTGQEIRCLTNSQIHDLGTGSAISAMGTSEPLNLPDIGTVWEMGVGYEASCDIIIYTERGKDSGLNIMLTQCAQGVIRGLEHLERYLFQKTASTVLEKYEGKHI